MDKNAYNNNIEIINEIFINNFQNLKNSIENNIKDNEFRKISDQQDISVEY